MALVANLIYYAVECGEVGGAFDLSEHLFFGQQHVDLLELVYFVQLLDQLRIRLLADKDVYSEGVVDQVD